MTNKNVVPFPTGKRVAELERIASSYLASLERTLKELETRRVAPRQMQLWNKTRRELKERIRWINNVLEGRYPDAKPPDKSA